MRTTEIGSIFLNKDAPLLEVMEMVESFSQQLHAYEERYDEVEELQSVIDGFLLDLHREVYARLMTDLA